MIRVYNLKKWGIGMEDGLRIFLKRLIEHYSNQKSIQYVCCNGTSEPVLEEYNPQFIIESKAFFEELSSWLEDYLEDKEKINYYEMFKAIVKETSGLWVNPTIEEMEAYYSENKKIKPYPYKWEVELRKRIKFDLDKNGYTIIQGKSIIDQLVNYYDLYNEEDISFIEWAEPIDIASIHNEKTYLIDREGSRQPMILTRKFILELDNHQFSIPPSLLSLYFKHIIVTNRGLESKKILKDNALEVSFYQNMSDYLKNNDYENEETAYAKLTQQSVEPSQPFIEIIADQLSESYMNQHKLKTEEDILTFINQAYLIEELDMEAKSFHRKKIIKTLLKQEKVNYSKNKIFKNK